MKVLLAEPRSFCAGVRMAIDAVEDALRLLGPPLHVFHQIVHNEHVVRSFAARGVRFVDSVDDVPRGAVLIFSAHGVSPAVRERARARRLFTVDATCPLVAKVHAEVVCRAREGYHVLLVGHAGHDEVEGVAGEAPGLVHVVGSPADVAALPPWPGEAVAYVTQTTLSVDEADVVTRAILARYPGAKGPPSSDICYATTNRQQAVRELAAEADVVLVVGSANSSNSQRLVEVAAAAGRVPAYRIDDVTELDPRWLDGADAVLVTAGASAPEHLVAEVVDWLRETYGATVEPRRVSVEQVTFSPPVNLRVLRAATV